MLGNLKARLHSEQVFRRYLKRFGALVAVLASLLIGILGARLIIDRTGSPIDLGSNLDPNAPTGLSAFTTDAIIRNLQNYLPVHTGDSVAYANLGIAYLQKARETFDPAWYVKAEGVLNKALELDPNNFRALEGAGALALSRHQFRDALKLGQQAQALNPHNAGIYGVIGDAQIELGMYADAFATFQQMVNLRPDLTSYARVSYARELSGDRPGAIEAMKQAVEAGGDNGEAVNWTRVQVGNLYFDQGDVTQSQHWYQTALNSSPTYPYAEAGMANVWAIQGRVTEAISMYTTLVNTYPLPQFVIALGDLEATSGRTAEAARQYDLVEVEEKLYAANGVDTDAETALFEADHDRNLSDALAQARAGYARRPSVTVADMLAWTLYKTGDYAEAQQMMNQALRLGTRNALMDYHAGMIAYRLGPQAVAADYLGKALELNPHFSWLYVDQAKQLLAQLQNHNSSISKTQNASTLAKDK